jgi:hypothetical protein
MDKACCNCKYIRGPYLPPSCGEDSPPPMYIPSYCKHTRKHFKTRNKTGKCSDWEPCFAYRIKLFVNKIFRKRP